MSSLLTIRFDEFDISKVVIDAPNVKNPSRVTALRYKYDENTIKPLFIQTPQQNTSILVSRENAIKIKTHMIETDTRDFTKLQKKFSDQFGIINNKFSITRLNEDDKDNIELRKIASDIFNLLKASSDVINTKTCEFKNSGKINYVSPIRCSPEPYNTESLVFKNTTYEDDNGVSQGTVKYVNGVLRHDLVTLFDFVKDDMTYFKAEHLVKVKYYMTNKLEFGVAFEDMQINIIRPKIRRLRETFAFKSKNGKLIDPKSLNVDDDDDEEEVVHDEIEDVSNLDECKTVPVRQDSSDEEIKTTVKKNRVKNLTKTKRVLEPVDDASD